MNSTLTLTKIHNPLQRTDRDIVCYEWKGESLSKIREKFLPDGLEFAISINGKVVTNLERIIPMPGDMVVFVPRLCGGDNENNKSIGRIIGMIIVAVAASYAGGPAGVAYFGSQIGASVAAAAIMVVGGILINALLPMPNKTNTNGTNELSSNNYSWNPQTLQQEGSVISRWYGENKLHGNIIGGFIERIGVKNYNNVLISLGTGPFFDIPSSSVKINDKFYSYFKDSLTPIFRMGYLNQNVIPNFNNTKLEFLQSVKITHANPFIYTTENNFFDRIEVEIYFPRGIWKYIKQPKGTYDLIDLSIYFRIEYSEHAKNEWYNIYYIGDRTVNYPNQHWSLGIMWSNLTYDWNNFVNKTWEEHLVGETSYADNNGNPYHYDGEIVRIGTTEYIWLWLTEGDPIYIYTNPTDNFIVSNYKTTPITLNFSSTTLEKGKAYDIRITRITEDYSDENTYGGEFYLSAIREVILDDFEYPGQVLCGLQALATDQLSGSLNFSCIAKCLQVRVFDGNNWLVTFTKNPAWICYDILSLPVFDNNLNVIRYDGINPSRLDTAKFLEWSEWCDELVPDGNGGTEVRYEFNGGFDSETNLWEAAFQICAIAGACLVWNGIKLTVAIDKPSNPVQLFTVGNCGINSFKETFLPMVDRAAEIEVDFIDASSDYKRTKLSVINENVNSSVNKVNLQLFGVTKASQAWRIAMRRLKNNELLVRTLEFTADIDAIACTVGDVINFQHDVPQWGFGGRIVSATETSVVLDAEVIIEENKAYTILFRLNDDTLVNKGVANLAGTYSELILSSPFDVIPEKYNVYAFGESEINVKPFRIIDISRNGDLQANLTCIEYNESIYNSDYNLPTIPTINYSVLDNFPSVINYTAIEKFVNKEGNVYDTISVSWNRPKNSSFNYIEIYVKYSNSLEYVDSSFEENLSFNTSFQGSCKIYLRTVNTAGQKQSLSDCPVISLEINGLSAYMPDIISVSQFYQGSQYVLRWTPVVDNREFVYEIRFGDEFVSAMILGTTSDNSWVTTSNGTYWITVKSQYSYSETPAEIIITGATLVKNVVATWDEFFTEWSGTLSGGVEVDNAGRLWLRNTNGVVETDGEYEIPSNHIIDIGSVQTCQVSIEYSALSDKPSADIDSTSDFDSISDFDGNYAGYSNVKLMLALSQNGINWENWIDFIPGPYTAQAFKMKAVFSTTNTSITAVLSKFIWTVDVPDRSELITNLSVNNSGTAIIFSKPFQIIPNVQVTILDAQAGDMVNFLAGPNESGLTLKIINDGVGVNRNCNIFAQAY